MFTLTLEEKKYEFDFEMALLDIKAERFSDAENKLSDIARKIKSSSAYLGIGMSKLGRYLTGGTTDEEIFFCFTKAIQLSNEKDETAIIISEAILKIMREFVELAILKFYEFNKAKSKEATSKLAFLGTMATAPILKSSNNAKLVNAAISVASVLNVSSAKEKQMSVALDIETLIGKMKSLEKNCETFLANFPNVKEAFDIALDEIDNYAITIITPIAPPELMKPKVDPVAAYLEGRITKGEKVSLTPDQFSLVVNSKLKSYKNINNVGGWAVLLFGVTAISLGIFFPEGKSSGDITEVIIGGIIAIIIALFLFNRASSMTLEKMEAIIKLDVEVMKE